MNSTALPGSTPYSQSVTWKKVLLISGILSSLLYLAINIIIPMFYDGYNSASQTVSELSAIGAPTRQMWVLWVSVYTTLLIAFGWGILMSANHNRPLSIVGILIIIHAFIGIFWPPMHQREVIAAGGGTISDTLHIVWTMITVPFFMLEVGFGAAAFGKKFRWYSIVTILVIILFGVLTGTQSPQMEANLPTPWMGVWERISMGGFFLWIVVFAFMLLRKLNFQNSMKGNNS